MFKRLHDWVLRRRSSQEAAEEPPLRDEIKPLTKDQQQSAAASLPTVTEAEASQEDAKADEESRRVGSPFLPGRPSGDTPPPWPGVYRIRYKGPSRRIMYIGVASNLRNRKSQHKSGGYLYHKLHDFYWQQARPDTTADALIAAEVAHIKRHKPPLNRVIGGNGRMRAAIERQLEKMRREATTPIEPPTIPGGSV